MRLNFWVTLLPPLPPSLAESHMPLALHCKQATPIEWEQLVKCRAENLLVHGRSSNLLHIVFVHACGSLKHSVSNAVIHY